MKKWLVLGSLGLAVAWGPYVYSELTSSPVRSHGKGQRGPLHFGADDSAEGAADDTAEPEQAAAEPATEDKPDDKAAAEAPTQDKAEDKAAEAEQPADKAADPHVAAKPGEEATGEAADDIERPTLPAQLVPTFRKVFDAEPRDAFWANDEEPRIRALFKEAGAAPDVISEVVCRKSVCRIGFTPDDLDAEPLTDLYAALNKNYGPSVSLDAKAGAVGERATLYVLREGFKLEH